MAKTLNTVKKILNTVKKGQNGQYGKNCQKRQEKTTVKEGQQRSIWSKTKICLKKKNGGKYCERWSKRSKTVKTKEEEKNKNYKERLIQPKMVNTGQKLSKTVINGQYCKKKKYCQKLSQTNKNGQKM